jgi:hypothetical protein
MSRLVGLLTGTWNESVPCRVEVCRQKYAKTQFSNDHRPFESDRFGDYLRYGYGKQKLRRKYDNLAHNAQAIVRVQNCLNTRYAIRRRKN